MAVNIVDPNDIIINHSSNINAVPKYEEMSIYAELIGIRKGHSEVIINDGGNSTDNTEKFSIGFMGLDPISNSYTTNWSKNSQISDTPQYEGIGITDIKVKMNSSFIPQVNVTIVDIRGMCIFNPNMKRSPYRMLFDFPPAQYILRIKGYYGKILEYKLHFVRENHEIDGLTGNFTINVEFIANSFAPLTDILFKYVEMIPLMYPNKDVVRDNTIPSNTHELISKLKSLYDNVNSVIKESTELKTITSNKEQININQKIITNLNGLDNYFQFINNDATNYKDKTLTLVNSKINLNESKLSKITLNDYSNLTNNDTKNTGIHKLLIGVRCDGNKINDNSALTPLDSNIDIKYVNNDEYSLTSSYLNKIEKQLLSDANITTTTNTGIKKTYVLFENNIYNCLDISEYYVKLVKSTSLKKEEITKNEDIINNKIDTIAIKNIGMMPTVYNIFKILCDDVDIMFDTLRQVCRDAEEHHNNPENINLFQKDINSAVGKINGKIQPFPSFMKESEAIGCRKGSLVKTYPDSSTFGYLPEMRFVDDFIKIFFTTKAQDTAKRLKSEQDASGNGLWYPISPIDSKYAGDTSYQPYSDYNNTDGISDNSVTNKILDTFLKRYYLLTQYIYSNSFYRKGVVSDTSNQADELIKLFGETEAINISLSITDKNIINNLLETLKASQDYNIIFKNTPSYTTDSDKITLGNQTYYNNTSNSDYDGIKVIDDTPIEVKNDSESDPVSNLVKSSKGILNLFYSGFGEYDDAKVSKDNLPYYDDLPIEDDKSLYINEKLDIYNNGGGQFSNSTITIKPDNIANIEFGDSAYMTILTDNLNEYLTKYIIISCAGRTKLPKDLPLYRFFKIPGIISLPECSLSYYGLCSMIANENQVSGGTTLTDINNVLDSYISGTTNNDRLKTEYVFLKNTINEDVDYFSTLSTKVRNNFFDVYTNFINTKYDGIYNKIIVLNESYLSDISTNNVSGDVAKSNAVAKLKPIGDYYDDIIAPLLYKKNIVNYSDKTFISGDPGTPKFNSYVSLNTMNTNSNYSNYRAINKKFMDGFFSNLKKYLNTSKEKQKEKQEDFNKSINDNDVKTQIYYSIKNIVDKWINGESLNLTGYPMNKDTGGKLIDSFAFVDRTMNDIGGKPFIDTNGNSSFSSGCIINAQSLLEIQSDNDINIFSVFSRLLSQNGFEFFPLQNYMVFDQTKKWEDCFKIDQTGGIDTKPGFICMLIGGTSNHLETGNGYEDDGILDLENANGFDESGCEKTSNLASGNINVFKVSYGRQNQSIFKNIKFDTKEFPETNDSLAILANLAGDNATASPVPKGQNIYNLYENRAYSCKITMMGNAMIQPTQYFQVENIPMYSGAYILLNIEHNINSNNQMTTEFSGTRILKYPNPIVTSFSTSVGLQTSGSGFSSSDNLNRGGMGIINPSDPNTIPPNMKGESYNILKI